MKNPETLKQQIEGIISHSPGNISVVLEVDQQLIIDKDSKRVYSSASLIKVPIIMEAYRQAETGEICLNETIEIKENQKVGGSGVIQSLTNGISLTIKDVLTLMIIVSDNSATNMMIQLLGQDSINQFCQSLGCYNTRLERKLMDYEARDKGYDNITSASDMMKFLQEIEQSNFLTEKSNQEILSILAAQQFQNKLPLLMDLDKVFVANKTGEIPGVEHDAAIIHYEDRKANVSVLIDQLEHNNQGREVMGKIGKAVYDHLVCE
ncbi:serine hydrolase [Heyndrickxia sp. NPDC080065]|uniref:serine hydrolase n=1 Tax=Heyndrickxia sp. NPDC080065 TaxID=3390568 RepID=UPI003D003BF7